MFVLYFFLLLLFFMIPMKKKKSNLEVWVVVVFFGEKEMKGKNALLIIKFNSNKSWVWRVGVCCVYECVRGGGFILMINLVTPLVCWCNLWFNTWWNMRFMKNRPLMLMIFLIFISPLIKFRISQVFLWFVVVAAYLC